MDEQVRQCLEVIAYLSTIALDPSTDSDARKMLASIADEASEILQAYREAS